MAEQRVSAANGPETAVSGTAEPFALYVHWPFCAAKCPYCDFNSHVRESVDQPRWRRALIRELDHFAPVMNGRKLGSIFFGGGTPSLMPPATVGALIEAAASKWSFAANVEVTLEANPTSVETSNFKALRSAGVNRVSLGVQALDDEALAFLGRGHSAREALDAVALAERIFDRYSFDLIYGRPGQTPVAWRKELVRAAEMADDHLSVYQLTIEKGTPFFAQARAGALVTPDASQGAALYEIAQDVLEGAGLPAYEISNHARPGAECRHNITYWLSGDYLGIGPGAHGRFARGTGAVATEQLRSPEAWLEAVEQKGHGTRGHTDISAPERMEEVLMMGLRLTAGIPHRVFASRTGRNFESALDSDRLARLIAGEFLILDEYGLRATSAGRLRLNAVLEALIA